MTNSGFLVSPLSSVPPEYSSSQKSGSIFQPAVQARTLEIRVTSFFRPCLRGEHILLAPQVKSIQTQSLCLTTLATTPAQASRILSLIMQFSLLPGSHMVLTAARVAGSSFSAQSSPVASSKQTSQVLPMAFKCLPPATSLTSAPTSGLLPCSAWLHCHSCCSLDMPESLIHCPFFPWNTLSLSYFPFYS